VRWRGWTLGLCAALALAGCVLDWSAPWLGDGGHSMDSAPSLDHDNDPDGEPADLQGDLKPSPPPWVWVSGGDGVCNFKAAARASDGGFVVGGHFSGSIKLNLNGKPTTITASPGVSDTLVLKLNNKGGPMWVYQGTCAGEGRVQDISVDGTGRIWVVGDFEKTITFPGSMTGKTLTAKVGRDGFILRLAPDGSNQLLAQVQGQDKEMVHRVHAIADGSALVGGIMGAGPTFQGETGLIKPSTAGLSAQVFLAKVTPKGTFKWVDQIGGAKSEELGGLAMSGGKIFVAGHFRSNYIDYNKDPATRMTLKGASDLFVLRILPQATKRKVLDRAQAHGSKASAQLHDLAMDTKGPVITGYYAGGPLNMVGASLTTTSHSELYVAALDSKLKARWMQRGTSSGGSAGWRVAIGGQDRVLVAGHYQGNFSIKGINYTSGRGGDEILALILSPGAGALQRIITTGDSGWDRAWALVPYAGDTALLAGEYTGKVIFNGLKRTSGKLSDGFVWRANLQVP